MRLLLCSALLLISSPLAAMKGVVYGDDGRPVTGAVVAAHLPTPADVTLGRLFDGSAAPPARATTTTTETGAFQLDIKGVDAVSLAITAEGYLPSRTYEAAADDQVAITLTGSSYGNGSVRSASGPVNGATVAFFTGNQELLSIAKTDARGVYPAPLAFGWAARVCIVHRDFVPRCEEAFTAAGVSSGEYTLSPGIAVKGRVVDETGKPFAGAAISVDQWPVAQSDEQGNFSVAHVDDRAKLRASARGRTGTGSAVANTTITVARSRSLKGSITDAKGRPLTGLQVLAGGDGEHWTGTISGARGAYEFSLPPGNYSVYVNPPAAWESDSAQADLRRGDATQNIVMRDAPMIRGVVVDEAKKPVGGAIVMVVPEEMPVVYGRMSQLPAATSAGNGAFRLRAMEGGDVRVLVLKPGFAAGRADVKTAGEAVNVTLPAGVEVSGIVVDGEGKPHHGAGIIAAEATQMLNAMPLGAAVASGTLGEWTRTGVDGRFTMRVIPGQHDFSAWKKGSAAADVGGVAAAKGSPPLRIVLLPAVTIRGQVVQKGRDGAPTGTVAAVSSTETGAGQTSIGANGSFVLDSLKPGSYTVFVQTPDGSASRPITAPDNNVVIELPALAALQGRVTEKATGTPVTNFTVVTSGRESQHYRGHPISDPDGRYSVKIPAGSIEVRVSADGFSKLERTVVATATGAAEVTDFALERGRNVTGTVVSAEGRALKDVTVTVGEEEYSGETAAAGDDGAFEIQGAPVAEMTLSFRARGHVTAMRKVAAGAENQRIDVTLSAGRKLSGRVVGVSGAGVGEVQVTASTQAHGADTQSATTSADGSFTVTGLADAHYDVTARADDGSTANVADVDVKRTVPLLLKLQSRPTGTIHGTVAGASGGTWMMGMVTATGENGSGSAQIQRDGTYKIEKLAAGVVDVVAMLMAPDRESTTRKVTTTLPPGGDIEVHLGASGDLTVNGQVSAAGVPAASHSVTFSTVDGQGRWRTTTGPNGSYQVTGLEPARYWIQVGQGNSTAYQAQFEVVNSTTHDIDITRATIAGHVVDAEGTPIPGANVVAVAGDKGAVTPAPATTDARGAFTIAAQGDQVYQLSGSARGFVNGTAIADPRTSAGVIITLRRGEGQVLRLVDARNGATLTGYVVVTDETGKVTIPANAEKQTDGSLHLALPDGRYRISASATDYASRTVRMTVPAPEMRMSLTPGGTLIVTAPSDARHLVRLVMPDGEEYVRCYCNGIAEIRLEGTTTRVPNVAPGVYRMDLLDPRGTVVRSYPVTIAEGRTTTVDASK